MKTDTGQIRIKKLQSERDSQVKENDSLRKEIKRLEGVLAELTKNDVKIINIPLMISDCHGNVTYFDEDKKGEECLIYDLYVDSDYRNKGTGTFLIDAAVKDIIKHNYTKIFIATYDRKLIPFFSKLGFVLRSVDEERIEMYLKESIVKSIEEQQNVSK